MNGVQVGVHRVQCWCVRGRAGRRAPAHSQPGNLEGVGVPQPTSSSASCFICFGRDRCLRTRATPRFWSRSRRAGSRKRGQCRLSGDLPREADILVFSAAPRSFAVASSESPSSVSRSAQCWPPGSAFDSRLRCSWCRSLLRHGLSFPWDDRRSVPGSRGRDEGVGRRQPRRQVRVHGCVRSGPDGDVRLAASGPDEIRASGGTGSGVLLLVFSVANAVGYLAYVLILHPLLAPEMVLIWIGGACLVAAAMAGGRPWTSLARGRQQGAALICITLTVSERNMHCRRFRGPSSAHGSGDGLQEWPESAASVQVLTRNGSRTTGMPAFTCRPTVW